MQVDDPPYLSVGTAVSAKYKGAFCEAKVSKVDRMVKCKVTFKSGLGAATVSDNEIKGTLRVGQQVQVKHPDHKDLVEATVTKIQDCSQYTVVFDDGDITTLRRTALCLKSGRHFNESETLDQLPLTHPEHFGIPVMGGRRGRRNRLPKDESSDEEIEEENEPDLEGYTQDIGRVVSVETGETKRGKEKWFPGLIVIPSAQPTVKINIKDEFLIRSFRDDRYYTVPKTEVNEFNRDLTEKIDSSGLLEAVQKANKFLDQNELPLHWEKGSLFNIAGDTDSEDNASDTSDEEQSEEKDRFVAQLYKYMDDSGTPLNKTPTISNKDIDLHRLFRVVDKMGGYNRVTNQNKWKSVAGKMRLSVNQNISNQVKSVYKKCLLSYEGFFKTLGVTMSNPTRPTKKDKGRSLIRDKDRTPISSPRPEREDEVGEKAVERKPTPLPEKAENKPKRKAEPKEKEVSVKKVKLEPKDAGSDISDTPSTSSTRPKRHESKPVREKKIKPPQGDKVKALVEKFEETAKKEEERKDAAKIQFTRSKSQSSVVKPKEVPKEAPKDMVTTRQSKEASTPAKPIPKPVKKIPVKEEETPIVVPERDKKPKLKKKADSDKPSDNFIEPLQTANLGDKLIVYYGPTNESKVTYEAKVVDMDKDQTGPIYLVHYTGWNTRYDEWIPACRIAENLSSGTKSKRSKVPPPVNVKPSPNGGPSTSAGPKIIVGKRSRLTSVSSRGPPEDKPPRSTTPSSVTSTSSITKSPATPATRSVRLAAKQDSKRRRISSAQTDISLQSESERESSESEAELPRTRSGSMKTEEPEVKVYRKRVPRPAPPPKPQKRKEPDDETEKEEEPEKNIKERKVKKIKKTSEKSADDESDDEEDGIGHPKGRDFDLNQIRSELKGFSKALKVPTVDLEKDSVSSSDDSSEKVALVIKEEVKEEITIKIEEEPKPKQSPPKLQQSPPKAPSPKLEKSSSSEDIYEFKEPEPFEFESRSKLVDDKNPKKRLPRIFDSLDDKSPRRTRARSPPSPGKSDKLGLPEPRTYSRLPKKIHISEDEDDDEDIMEEEDSMADTKNEDPFDKLIESPCFNITKTSMEKAVVEDKPILFNENLFKEPPETSDEYSRDMELSDCESQTQIFTREDTLFSNTFSKSSTDRNTPDFSSSKTDEGKTTNSDDDDIQAQIQRAIAQSSSTDDDSDDALISMPPDAICSPKKVEEPPQPTKIISVLGLPVIAPVSELSSTKPFIEKEAIVPLVPVSEALCSPVRLKETLPPKPEPAPISPSVTETKPLSPIKPLSPKKPIDPALQETDSTLLESIVSKPPLILNPKLDDTGKELTVKTGTRIADSILQKFNFIKNNIGGKTEAGTSGGTSASSSTNTNLEKLEVKTTCTKPVSEPGPSTSEPKVKPATFDIKPRPSIEGKLKTDDKLPDVPKAKPAEVKPSVDVPKPSTSKAEVTETRRRRRAISKATIDESDSDSSDSEHLVIGSDDDDSQTSSSDNKPLIECKNNDSNMSLQKIITTTDDSQSQPEIEKRNFSFDDILPKEDSDKKVEEPPKVEPEKEEEIKTDQEQEKEDAKEDQDPTLHSLLLCEEEIPRSPAPASELPSSNEGVNVSSVHEMPFASAPGSSNSKMLLEPKKHQPPPLIMPLERESRVDAQAVIENTPPTTPESTISNLSPRGDNGNISPNSNDSKSNEGEPDYVEHRRSGTMKLSPYSEEDTQPESDHPSSRKISESFGPPMGYRKRRRSLRNSEDGPSGIPAVMPPAKRGRKPRQRRDSDSDDASESSMAGSGCGGNTPGSTTSLYERSARSPRPSKYNFFVEFDPSLDSTQRIAVLQQKLSELRKTYADVKAELAAVERRRKKIRRREREAIKTAKQEMACA